ncbi:MAG: hypothetical protein KFF50_07610, partial [Desulfatitalea sp.]|nr:hypothetical protein [Desulfatitalea sp.]
KPPAQAPTANAGTDQTVSPSSRVTLNGSASKDPDGGTLTYTWTQTAGPNVQLSNTRAVRPTFTAPAASTKPIVLTFRLTVRNPKGLSVSDTCQVVINAVNPPAQAPVAQAGPNQTVTSNASVRLNGSESFHPDKKTLSYLWVQTGGPKVSLSSAKTARPRFTAPTAPTGGRVTLVFELTVTDPNRLTSSDTCLVQVVPAPAGNPPAESPAPPANEPPKPDEKAPVPAQPELPPKQPMVYFPVDGATNISLTPRLTASAFSGGDVDDTHLRSQWRVWKTQNKQTVLDVTRKRNPLNTLWIPFFTLSPGTTYACQVRYFDHQGQASKWSSPVHFTTRSSWFTRSASNLTDETSIPVAVDLDVEGITGVEMLQAVQTADGSYLVAVEIESDETVESIDVVAAVAPDSTEPQPPFESTHPNGLLGYRIQLVAPGQEASVILHFSDPIEPLTTWIAYGADGEWVDCTHNVQVQADGMTVVRTIVDGGEEDADGVANGTIVDLLAPLQIAADLPPPEQSGGSGEQSSASGSGGGGCFIGALFQ